MKGKNVVTLIVLVLLICGVLCHKTDNHSIDTDTNPTALGISSEGFNKLLYNGLPIDRPELFSPTAWVLSSYCIDKARALFALNRIEEAIAVLDSGPGGWKLERLHSKGLFLFALERFDEAEAVQREALELCHGQPTMKEWLEAEIEFSILSRMKREAKNSEFKAILLQDTSAISGFLRDVLLMRSKLADVKPDFVKVLNSQFDNINASVFSVPINGLLFLFPLLTTDASKEIIENFFDFETYQKTILLDDQQYERTGLLYQLIRKFQTDSTIDYVLLQKIINWEVGDRIMTQEEIARWFHYPTVLGPLWMDVLRNRHKTDVVVALQRMLLLVLADEKGRANKIVAENLLFSNCSFLMATCENEQAALIVETLMRNPWLPLEYEIAEEISPSSSYDDFLILRLLWYVKHGVLF